MSHQSCDWKGTQVCEGAVTLEKKSLFQVDVMVIVDEDIKHDVDDPVNQSPPVHGDGGLPLLW